MTIRSLHHIALAVPDPAKGRDFYKDFGLEPREDGARVVMRCQGRDQDQVVLVEGKKKTPASRQFHSARGGPARAEETPRANGTKLVDAPKETPGEGIWFRDPDGLLVNVRAGEPKPWRSAPEWKINNPGHLNRSGVPGYPKRDIPVRPTRLGHTLRFTPQMEKVVDFYMRVVGLQLSDRAQDIVAFMRGHGGSDHHIFGFIKSDRPASTTRASRSATSTRSGMGACRLLDKGYKDGWASAGTSSARLLPLHPRSVGQHGRVLLRYRLHPGRC